MLIEVKGLSKRYSRREPMVVEDISFAIDRGETIAVFGESGCGKSTIAQILAGLFPATAGEILFDSRKLSYPFSREVRHQIQILFQHPEVSFNPKMRLISSMKEPCRFGNIPFDRASLCRYLSGFGIYDEHLERYPSELSGGELQRLALARVMLMKPSLLVLDEPTSMLDVISQAQMIRLLQQVQKRDRMAYLFISHDMELCRCFADRIYRLNAGKLTEIPRTS